MAKLYELAIQYRTMLEMEPESDEELAAMMTALDEAEGDINQKVENICRSLKNDQGDIDALFAEEKRLYARRKALSNKADRIKAYIAAQLAMAGLREIHAGVFKVGFKKNQPAVSIMDESKIPAKYWIEQAPALDRMAIKEALKNGEAVAGVELTQGESLQIR